MQSPICIGGTSVINGTDLKTVHKMLESNTLKLMQELVAIVDGSSPNLIGVEILVPTHTYLSVDWVTLRKFFKIQKWVVDLIEGEDIRGVVLKIKIKALTKCK